MTDDTAAPEAVNDPLSLALSVLAPEERQRFGDALDALTDAYDARRHEGMPSAPPAAAARRLAEHYRSLGDPIWAAWSATAAVAENSEG